MRMNFSRCNVPERPESERPSAPTHATDKPSTFLCIVACVQVLCSFGRSVCFRTRQRLSQGVGILLRLPRRNDLVGNNLPLLSERNEDLQSIKSALLQLCSVFLILLTQYQIINSMNANVNTQLLHKCRPAPSVGPRYPPSANSHEYAVTPNRTVRRTGTFASQYSRAGRASREAAVRSERPKNVRRTAMKADASLDLSIVAM
jgi:hypothetical protein